MRTLRGFVFSFLIASCLFAQHRGGAVGSATPRAGAAAAPAAQARGFQPGVPSALANPNFGTNLGLFTNRSGGNRVGGHGFGHTTPVYVGYPIYVGGYGGYGYGYGYGSGYSPDGYGGYYDSSYMGQPNPQQQSGSVTVVYPPQPAPVIINQFGQGDGQYPTVSAPPPGAVYQPPVQSQTSEPANEPAHYLIAFKDHTIYSAVAYWVQGDTLHYFTDGNTHNQVSISLVDYDLTMRLNKESGIDLKLPAAK